MRRVARGRQAAEVVQKIEILCDALPAFSGVGPKQKKEKAFRTTFPLEYSPHYV